MFYALESRHIVGVQRFTVHRSPFTVQGSRVQNSPEI